MGSLATAPPLGDKCTVNWRIWARDEAEAKEICTDMGIHHLKSWTRDSSGYAQCEYESIHICRDGWTQIRGRCYKIGGGGQLMYHGPAYDTCENEGGTMFAYYSEEIARLLAEYFVDLPGIWAFIPDLKSINNVETPYTQDDKSFQLLMAYGTANWYGLGYMSLVKLNDNGFGTAMCEYIPPDTPLSFRVKLEKLRPYYHPGHADGVNTFWRTANFYNDRIVETSTHSFRRECQKSMRPLLNSKLGKDLDPTKTTMSQMPEELKKSNSLTYAPFRVCDHNDDRMVSTAVLSYRQKADCDFQRVTSTKYNIDCSDCRGNYPKQEFVFFNANGVDYKIEKDSKLFGPFWCTVEYYPPKDYKPCDQGWTQYERKDGSRWCHKHFRTGSNPLERSKWDAKSYCAAQYNAELGGWEEEREFKTLKAMGTGHVNVEKNTQCSSVTSFGNCAKDRMFFHYSRAGDDSFEGSELIAKLMAPGQPDRGTDEQCVDIRSDGLHDISCSTVETFFCSKEAEEIA